MYSITVILVLSFFTSYTLASEPVNNTSFEQYYHMGVEAYLDERWEDCINDLETAIHTYKMRLVAIADCRVRCQYEPFEPLMKADIDNLHFYEKMIKKTLCFLKCKRKRYPKVEFEVLDDLSILKLMEDLDPYNYLHICYYQKKLSQKAASAAFTYLAKHPTDQTMKRNLEFYMTLPNVDPTEISNYEAAEYFALYLHGIKAYNNEDWESVVAYIDESLQAYFTADQRCRSLCETSFDQGWLPDFTTSISNHFTFCLKCKLTCSEKLKTLDNQKGKNLLADHYNYLQFANYKLGKMAHACRALASYLLVHPGDTDMLRNKEIYLAGSEHCEMTPSQDMVHYLNKEKYETKLINFINKSFAEEFKTYKALKDSENEKSNDL